MNVSRRRFLYAAATATAAAAAGCSRPESEPAPTPVTTSSEKSGAVETSISEPPPTEEDVARGRVPDDLRARVATLMHVGVTGFDDALAKLRAGVGGIFVTSWADSALLTEPERDLFALREVVGRSFAVSIDFEGGRVQRHSHVLGSYPSPQQMAAGGVDEVKRTARAIGASLRAHGVTVNFAPVLDVDGAGLAVVGDRSFSADPARAGEFGAAFARGLIDAGIAPVYKHFPGHGQASGDTHEMLAVTPPLDQVIAHDLPPFAFALREVPAPVMVGHMTVPGLGADGQPSSLDPAVYELLRSGDYPEGRPCGELTYTDDLSGMRAITDAHPLAEAVTLAIEAGADQALWSSGADVEAAIDAVVAAVDAGKIPVQRIDDAAFRLQLQLLRNGL